MDAEMQPTADQAATEQCQHDVWASGDISHLDVASGSGNASLAVARRGCRPTGIDHLPALLEQARARAERLRAHFQLGDPEAVPFSRAPFDVVLSVFGVMFTPDQQRVASEMRRVCRPGGIIGLAHGAADGFIRDILQAGTQNAPPVRRLPEAAAW